MTQRQHDELFAELGITSSMVRALRDEASRVCDDAMARICTFALGGCEASIRECGRVIADARAQHDYK